MAIQHALATSDEFLWLEQRKGKTAQQWVKQQNQRTTARFADSEHFQQTEQQILNSLNDKSQIPWFS